MQTDGSVTRFSYRTVEKKFNGPGPRKDRKHFKRGRLLCEELGLGAVSNKIPEVPRRRTNKVDRLLLPQRGEVIVEAYRGKDTALFPVHCFLHTDDWSQILLKNLSFSHVHFRILYYNPIEMFLKLILCKDVPAHASAVIVLNALGLPLRCSGYKWSFSIIAFSTDEGKFDLDFTDWEGKEPKPIPIRGDTKPENERNPNLEPIAEENKDLCSQEEKDLPFELAEIKITEESSKKQSATAGRGQASPNKNHHNNAKKGKK